MSEVELLADQEHAQGATEENQYRRLTGQPPPRPRGPEQAEQDEHR